ncbi:MAG: PQQ-binding-like beta-propeller repeat protein, partial [bacterium]|nr:PQQ-binding-like beta-propeller repeat protein [bacterium]
YFSNPEAVYSGEENSVFNNELTGNWPSFRGPGGNGKAHFTDVPDSWNPETGENIIWRQKLELEGLSSPVVWDNQIYLTGGNKEKFIIYCYSFNDGGLIWKYTVKENISIESGFPEVSTDTGFAAASAAVDSKGVYGIFASGDLIALDHNGKLKWEKNLGAPENIYGHSSSLIILDNLLFVQYDHSRDGALYGIDTGTGEINWQVKREMGTSWASPILAPGASGINLVLSSNPFVTAYNPYTGEELWRTDCLGGEVASSPAYYKGIVYAASEYSYLNALDVDTGVILWQDYEFLPDTSSLGVTNDSVYLCTSYGVFACFNREKGELEWFTEDLSPKGCYSSPIIVGDRIFILTREGESIVFSTLKENKVLGRSQLNENIDTTPAFYKNRIIIRGKDNLYCIGFIENNNE